MIQPTKIKVSDSVIAGRGIFATANISEGEILEECHFIELSQSDYSQLDNLKDYVYTFPMFNKNNCIVFGMGSIYNHSVDSASAYWETDEENNLFRFIALADIAEGDEILIDYQTSTNF